MRFAYVLPVLLLTAALGGCASAITGPPETSPPLDATLVEQYAERLPAGARVKVEKTNGDTLHGTLLKAAPDAIVVQTNTRVPEPPVEIRFTDIARLTVDQPGGSTGRAVGIGIATGVGYSCGILVLAAVAALVGG